MTDGALDGLSVEAALPLLDYLCDGIVILDDAERVVGFNTAMERISGLERSRVMGRTALEVFPCRLPDGRECPEGFGPGDPHSLTSCRTLLLERPDGALRSLQVRFRPVPGNDGAIRYWMGTVRDVTQEEELHSRERRARAVAGIAQIAQELAEELRNPLNGIDIQVQLLSRMLDRPTPRRAPEAGRVVKLVRQEIRRLNSTLEDLFEVNRRRQAGRRRSEIRALLEELARVLAPRAEAQGVRIEIDTQDGLEPAYLDADALLRALLHLGINALEAMPRGGALLFQAFRTGDELQIVIADTGPGIPDHLKERIFRMFYSTKPGSAGVGLPLAASILAEQGGRLALDRSDQGAAFLVTLPLR